MSARSANHRNPRVSGFGTKGCRERSHKYTTTKGTLNYELLFMHIFKIFVCVCVCVCGRVEDGIAEQTIRVFFTKRLELMLIKFSFFDWF